MYSMCIKVNVAVYKELFLEFASSHVTIITRVRLLSAPYRHSRLAHQAAGLSKQTAHRMAGLERAPGVIEDYGETATELALGRADQL